MSARRFSSTRTTHFDKPFTMTGLNNAHFRCIQFSKLTYDKRDHTITLDSVLV